MELDEYKKLDNQLERLNLTYDGLDISYLIRNHVISLIRTKENVGNSEVKVNSKVILRLIRSLIITVPKILKKRSIWVFSNAERRKKFDEFYVDRVGSLVSESKERPLYIENPIICNHKFPTKEDILSDAFFFLGSFLFGIIFFKNSKLKLDQEVFKILKTNNISGNIPSIVKRFVGQYRFMRFFLKYHSRPKKVFIVYPNGYYGYIFALKMHKVPIIELQHGIIYEGHPSYNTILYSKAQIFKPNYIFTYGTRDTALLKQIKYIDSENIITVGSYGLWLAKESKLRNSYINNLIDHNKKTIVMIATANDLEIMIDLAKKIRNFNNNFNLLILPRINDLLNSKTKGITLLDVNKANVFELYKIADFVITISSTSALESLFMGVPTFVYEFEGRSIFKENYAFIQSLNYFNNETSFLELINKENFSTPIKEDVEQIYSSDVINNFLDNSKMI